MTWLTDKLAWIGALIAGVVAFFFYAKRQGKEQEQAAELERSLKEAKEANEIDDKVHSMSDADLDKQLRSVRPPKEK